MPGPNIKPISMAPTKGVSLSAENPSSPSFPINSSMLSSSIARREAGSMHKIEHQEYINVDRAGPVGLVYKFMRVLFLQKQNINLIQLQISYTQT